MLVMSTPLYSTLLLVAFVPLTDGDTEPVSLLPTGGRSALTPAVAVRRWLKFRVEEGTAVISSPLKRRETVGVVVFRTGEPASTVTTCERPPTSSATLIVRGTAASTTTPDRLTVLNPSSWKASS